VGKSNQGNRKFNAQSTQTLLQKDRSLETQSVCSPAPGRISERNCQGIWLCTFSSTKGFETLEDHTKKKTTRYQEQEHDKVAAYKYEIANVLPETIAYVDETGIDQYLYWQYGYAPREKTVHGVIRGRRYARVGVVAARMGKEIIAPYRYDGTMDHKLFEDWFENNLLPALPKETVIVMDNASFHRKEQLYCLAQKPECFLMFLPPYALQLNPIEHFWAWLKRCLQKILPLSVLRWVYLIAYLLCGLRQETRPRREWTGISQQMRPELS